MSLYRDCVMGSDVGFMSFWLTRNNDRSSYELPSMFVIARPLDGRVFKSMCILALVYLTPVAGLRRVYEASCRISSSSLPANIQEKLKSFFRFPPLFWNDPVLGCDAKHSLLLRWLPNQSQQAPISIGSKYLRFFSISDAPKYPGFLGTLDP